ncbi:MAG: MFS transporter [Haloferacaceae archaeon]
MDGTEQGAQTARVPGGLTTLAASTGAYFAIRFGQVVVSPALPDITRSLGVTTSAAGGALTAMWAAYAAMQLPSGVLADRVGERRTILASLCGVAVASSLVALAPSYLGFLVALAALGAGAGLYYNAAASLLSRTLAGVGTALGLHKLGSRAAGLAAPALAAVALVRFGWRTVPLLAVGVALVGLAEVIALVAPTPPPASDGDLHLREGIAALGDPVVARTTALTSAGEFTEQAAMSFLPTALVVYHGLGVGAASGLFSAFFAASAASGAAMGWLSDRAGPNAAALLTALAGVAGFGALAAAGTDGLALLAAVSLAGVATGWTAPLQSRVLDVLSESGSGGGSEGSGTGFGAFRTAYVLAGSTGSVVVGTLADVAGWRVALAGLAALLGGVALWLVVERLG